ncbi:hypothetical protein [Streptomyces microflavus]|uniref:hypothetical protein n=1 Tax=Streptomyces microflavus TaxID=1919 RepID=UPI0033BEA273
MDSSLDDAGLGRSVLLAFAAVSPPATAFWSTPGWRVAAEERDLGTAGDFGSRK